MRALRSRCKWEPTAFLFLSASLIAVTAPAGAAPRIQDAEFRQYEDGPRLPQGFEFRPGDTVFFDCRIGGYKADEKDRIRLHWRFEARDFAQRLLVEPTEGKTEAELAPQDKEWMPKLRFQVMVPVYAASGDYRLRVTVKDDIAGEGVAGEFAFRVLGKVVEESDTLVVRNFRFLRDEEDGPPLVTSTYRRPEPVWARFEITGFRGGEKNAIEVSYDVGVLDPSGKMIYAQKDAAVERTKSYYPIRYVPGIVSLQLRPDTTPGEYTILLTLRDGIGKQEAVSKHTFRVE
jgi:hypothetical protein